MIGVTVALLAGFITVHLLGNLSVFMGVDAINIYAEKLHSLGPIVWIFRAVMAVLFIVHITFGIQLTMENSTASPEAYAIKKKLKTTFAAERRALILKKQSREKELADQKASHRSMLKSKEVPSRFEIEKSAFEVTRLEARLAQDEAEIDQLESDIA